MFILFSLYTRFLLPIVILVILIFGISFSNHTIFKNLIINNQNTSSELQASSDVLLILSDFKHFHGKLFQHITEYAAGNTAESEKNFKETKELAVKIHKNLSIYAQNQKGDDKKQLLKLAKEFKTIVVGNQDDGIVDVTQQVIQMDWKFIFNGISEYNRIYKEFDRIITEKIKNKIIASQDTVHSLSKKSQENIEQIEALSTCISLIAIFITILLLWNTIKSIHKISYATEKLAKGNVDIDLEKFTRNDELGGIVNALSVFKYNQIEIQRLEKEKIQQEIYRAIEKEKLIKEREDKIIKKIEDVIISCAEGDFTKKISTDEKSGLIFILSEKINEISHTTLTSITEVQKALKELAKGNLSYKIDKDFKGIFNIIKNDFNGTVELLYQAFNTIKKSAIDVDYASQELSSTIDDFSTRTEKQAHSLGETIGVSHEVSDITQKTVLAFEKSDKLVTKLIEKALNGHSIINDAVISINEVAILSEQIKNISTSLDEIAIQTNLLAVNASIEAARAGDKGRGFDIVAQEVRFLAIKSFESSQSIHKITKEISGKIDASVSFANHSGQAFEKILEAIKNVSEIISTTVHDAKKQNENIDSIVGNVLEIGSFTRQNEELADNNIKTVKLFSSKATRLIDSVSYFNV